MGQIITFKESWAGGFWWGLPHGAPCGFSSPRAWMRGFHRGDFVFLTFGPTMADSWPKMSTFPIGMKKMRKKERRSFCFGLSRAPQVVRVHLQQWCEDPTEPKFWFASHGAGCSCANFQKCYIPHQFPQFCAPQNGSKNYFHAKMVGKMSSPSPN